MSFVLGDLTSVHIDYTGLIDYTINKPPMRVVQLFNHHVVLPRGVHVVHTVRGVFLSCKALKNSFGSSIKGSYKVKKEVAIDVYIRVMKDLAKCWSYANANHSQLVHTDNPRLSKSTLNYRELGIEPIRGIVIFQAKGSYFVSVEVNGRNQNTRVGQIGDKDIHEKAIRRIYGCILQRGKEWLKQSVDAQNFLKKYILE